MLSSTLPAACARSKPDFGSLRVRRTRNARDVETLAGPVLHAGQHHERDAMTFARQQRFEILVPQAVLARTRSGFDQRVLG